MGHLIGLSVSPDEASSMSGCWTWEVLWEVVVVEGRDPFEYLLHLATDKTAADPECGGWVVGVGPHDHVDGK